MLEFVLPLHPDAYSQIIGGDVLKIPAMPAFVGHQDIANHVVHIGDGVSLGSKNILVEAWPPAVVIGRVIECKDENSALVLTVETNLPV